MPISLEVLRDSLGKKTYTLDSNYGIIHKL
jgi:hypothetical protein